MSVRFATVSCMMDNTEADNFRQIQLESEVERAEGLIAQYRESIKFYRRRIDRYHNWLGHIEERLDQPERGEHDDH
jgi:hypothetical protein